MLRFVKNQFNSDQVTTVGAAFLQCPVPQEDSDDKIQFGIWDTAGSERFKALAPMVRGTPPAAASRLCSRRSPGPFARPFELSLLSSALCGAQYYRGAEAAIVVYDVTSFVRPPPGHRTSSSAPCRPPPPDRAPCFASALACPRVALVLLTPALALGGRRSLSRAPRAGCASSRSTGR